IAIAVIVVATILVISTSYSTTLACSGEIHDRHFIGYRQGTTFSYVTTTVAFSGNITTTDGFGRLGGTRSTTILFTLTPQDNTTTISAGYFNGTCTNIR
ncbi:MAG: hypothetical protein M1368_11815, partial [Thaumarchaeota archaeon]|nr:hypothetical protein [Nitrososphaerota archaeon]